MGLDFYFLCFNKVYKTIYFNLLMKYNKIFEKMGFFESKNERKGIYQK